ncbi:unnamed protein product [Prorocentrum cordatum]|uniref:Uncharacterized protein n=1 Tax=Prorocentrum cordatum TaxID=2364126 RepID=A0ABN9YF35_9DINO|nr:unnamed protein product [Polarella glacialis]
MARGQREPSVNEDAVDTQEFRNLLLELQDYRETSLGLVARHLQPAFQKKRVLCKAFYEPHTGRQGLAGNEASWPPDARIMTPKCPLQGLRWNIKQDAVAAEMKRQGAEGVDIKFCLNWHRNEFQNDGQLVKGVNTAGYPACSNDANSLAALIHLMVLEHLELIASPDGGMTVLGDVLADTPRQFQEPRATGGPSVGTESSEIASAAGAEAVAEGGAAPEAVEAPLDRVAASAAATSALLLPVAAEVSPHRCDLAFLADPSETERRILLAKGLKTKLDMASLRMETLDKMFGLPSPAFLATRAAASRLLAARVHDSDEEEKDKASRAKAADLLIEVFGQNLVDVSDFQHEAEQSGVTQCLTHYRGALANSFEASGMMFAGGVLRRWLQWVGYHTCSARALAECAAKGKVRHGAVVFVAGPTSESPRRRALGAMCALLQHHAPDATHFVPDSILSAGSP